MARDNADYTVIKPEVKRETFLKAAAELGLVKHRERPGDGHKESFQQIWATPDQQNAIHYVEDPISGTHFFSVEGPNTQKLVFELMRRVYSFAPEELVEDAVEAKTHKAQVEAVSRLAVAFPHFDPEVFEIFSGYLTEAPNPLLRAATVNAIGYRCWPECIPLLERAAQEDPDVQVRQAAERLLPYLRQNAQR